MNLYIECFSGISGDMTLGALLDLGMPLEYLMEELKKLPVDGYRIEVKKEGKMGIFGTQVTVVLDSPTHGHSHGHGSHSHGSHSHGHHSHGHDHQHEHNHSAAHHHDENRTFASIKKLITNSSLGAKVKDDSIAVFQLIADAEGKIHNKPANEVHFHEVGAVDSIVDIVGAAIGFNYFKFDKVISTPVELGGGFVNCAHGKFPVPAPATLDILKDVPFTKGTVDKETTTPTGAAILKHFVTHFTSHFEGTVSKTMYGVGHRDLDIPNVLRVSICNEIDSGEVLTERALLIECNLDDMSPEYTGYLMQKVLDAGAKDVFITPVTMKKSRPGIVLSILIDSTLLAEVQHILFTETSTIGFRYYAADRKMLPRKSVVVDTTYGKITVKRSTYGDTIKDKPEYNDCVRAARENNIPVSKVIDEALKQLKQMDDE